MYSKILDTLSTPSTLGSPGTSCNPGSPDNSGIRGTLVTLGIPFTPGTPDNTCTPGFPCTLYTAGADLSSCGSQGWGRDRPRCPL